MGAVAKVDYGIGGDRDMARLVKYATPDPNSGCWLWAGPITNDGYGQLSVRHEGRDYGLRAHRYMYAKLVCVPDPDLVLDHKCRTPLCVNPAHLEEVPQMENILRSPLANQHKTHCPHGHKYTPENTKPVTVKGYKGRACRACEAAGQRRRYAARKMGD